MHNDKAGHECKKQIKPSIRFVIEKHVCVLKLEELKLIRNAIKINEVKPFGSLKKISNIQKINEIITIRKKHTQ